MLDVGVWEPTKRGRTRINGMNGFMLLPGILLLDRWIDPLG